MHGDWFRAAEAHGVGRELAGTVGEARACGVAGDGSRYLARELLEVEGVRTEFVALRGEGIDAARGSLAVAEDGRVLARVAAEGLARGTRVFIDDAEAADVVGFTGVDGAGA